MKVEDMVMGRWDEGGRPGCYLRACAGLSEEGKCVWKAVREFSVDRRGRFFFFAFAGSWLWPGGSGDSLACVVGELAISWLGHLGRSL